MGGFDIDNESESFGRVIWICGLSGAGKSSVAKRLRAILEQLGKPCILLDGDQLREILNVNSFASATTDRDSRLTLALRYSALCKLLANQGHIVIIATISMFKEIYSWNKQNLPGYFQVFLDTPINILQERDSKGIYGRLSRGEIKNVAGLDLAVDIPADSHLTITYDRSLSIDEVAKKIQNKLFTEKKFVGVDD